METREEFEAALSKAPSGCWLWTRGTNRGYGQVQWKGKQQGAHRVAWQLYNGAIPEGLFVCHKCDVPACCNPEHLFLGTANDNVQDMRKKGRGLLGRRRLRVKDWQWLPDDLEDIV